MKQLVVVILLMVGINIFGSNNAILPLKLQPGMSLKKLVADYPKGKIVYPKKDEEDKIVNCLFHLKIKNNPYWDSALINVKNGFVTSLAYTRVQPLTKSEKIKNIQMILKLLKGKYGNSYDKKISKQFIKEKKKKENIPLLVWSIPKRYKISLSCAPFKDQKTGGIYFCSLSLIGENIELKTLFEITEIDAQEMDSLFKDLK